MFITIKDEATSTSYPNLFTSCRIN